MPSQDAMSALRGRDKTFVDRARQALGGLLSPASAYAIEPEALKALYRKQQASSGDPKWGYIADAVDRIPPEYFSPVKDVEFKNLGPTTRGMVETDRPGVIQLNTTGSAAALFTTPAHEIAHVYYQSLLDNSEYKDKLLPLTRANEPFLEKHADVMSERMLRSGLRNRDLGPSGVTGYFVNQFENVYAPYKEKHEAYLGALNDYLTAVDNLNGAVGNFDPEGRGYDYKSAIDAGQAANEAAGEHWSSRVASGINEGQILKGRGHETFHKTIAGEKASGYEMFRSPASGGRYYSRPVRGKGF